MPPIWDLELTPNGNALERGWTTMTQSILRLASRASASSWTPCLNAQTLRQDFWGNPSTEGWLFLSHLNDNRQKKKDSVNPVCCSKPKSCSSRNQSCLIKLTTHKTYSPPSTNFIENGYYTFNSPLPGPGLLPLRFRSPAIWNLLQTEYARYPLPESSCLLATTFGYW